VRGSTAAASPMQAFRKQGPLKWKNGRQKSIAVA
jgi:hypothetical protein